MKRCQMKTGFFVLRECGAVAVAQCNDCKKNFCLEHIYGGLESIQNRKKDEQSGLIKARAGEEPILCLECYAKRNNEEIKKKYQGGYSSANTSNDLLWYFYMRDSFYRSTNFRPFDDDDRDSIKTHSTDFDDDSSSNTFFDS